MKEIRTISELSTALTPKISAILDSVARDVKSEIDDTLGEYYREYTPIYYNRTDQLRDCCKIGKVTKQSNSVVVEVYLDIDSLEYRARGADPYKTVVAANSGLHGGFDPNNVSLGQVPWDIIRSNTGTPYGGGTQIWEKPMQRLLNDREIVALFKKHALSHGIKIK